MKGKHFYSHLIEIHEIYSNLSEMELSDEQRVHLISLVEVNIHTTVIHAVLSELPEEDKKVFLKNLVADNHEETWKHLLEKAQNIENKINKSLQDLKEELLTDIEESKKLKST
jgi:hypothetical protein